MLKKYINRVLYKINSNIKFYVSAAQLHKDTFLPYKNFCKGERDLVICGAGPSLRNYKPIEGAIHIAVNRAFLYEKVQFDFIFAQDMEGIKMVADELVEYNPDTCVKFLSISELGTVKTIPESLAIKCNAKRFYLDIDMNKNGFLSKMVLDLENKPLGGMPNVGMSVMQLALYMNPKKLYIVGCDMSGAHFAPGNETEDDVKKNEREYGNYWKSCIEPILNKWREIKEFAEVYYPDIKIYSINPVGLKNMFEDIYQD